MVDNKAKKEAIEICNTMEKKEYAPVFQKTMGNIIYMLFIGPTDRYILTISSSLGNSYCDLKGTVVENL